MIQYRKLIDVSSHNGTINWKKVKESGVDYAILRLGYAEDKPEYDDKKFIENVKGCIENNVKWGTYLYSYANKIMDALSEASHVRRKLKEVKDLYNAWPELGIFYDLEDAGTTGKCSNGEILNFAQTFYNSLKLDNNLYKIGIYASLSWFQNKLVDRWYREVPDDLWIAHYTKLLPTSEEDFMRYSKDYSIWQYSDGGKVDGIGTSVDLNVVYLEEKEFVEEQILEEVEKIEEIKEPIIEESMDCMPEIVDIVEEIEDTENGAPVEIEENLDKALENTIYGASLNLKKALNELGSVIVEEVARVGEKIVNSFKGLGKLFKK